MWFRIFARACGFVACAIVVALAAQWLSISFGWDPLISVDRINARARQIAGPLREGPAMLVAIGVGIVGLIALAAWLMSMRSPSSDATFRAGPRRERLRIDRDSLAASLERRLQPIDRRVDATVSVSSRGGVDLRLVTPDPSTTGPVSEHTAALADLLTERALPCRVRRVDVIDVRKLKSRHRVR